MIQIPLHRNGQICGQKSNNKHFSIYSNIDLDLGAACNMILFKISWHLTLV